MPPEQEGIMHSYDDETNKPIHTRTNEQYEKRYDSSSSDDDGEEYESLLTDIDSNIDGDLQAGLDVMEKNQLILFGVDMSRFSRVEKFIIMATGVFFFTIIYGYLQELIVVHIAGRKFGIFLASVQFLGYSFWAFVLDTLNPEKRKQIEEDGWLSFIKKSMTLTIPLSIVLGLSTLKALDLGLTYGSLQYINYPAKSLIKSSRVVFTMILGVVLTGKTYSKMEYANVLLLVAGLVIFLHADAKSDAVFHPIGVILLCSALMMDGILSNFSEVTMNKYKVGHDSFQLNLSLIASIVLAVISMLNGQFEEGVSFFLTPGSMAEIETGAFPTWSPMAKILTMFLFSSFGLFGASCAGAITKTYGAFYMSLTTTSRKASSLMVSFAFFPNTLTFQHALGITIFMAALVFKSVIKLKENSLNTSSRKRSRSDLDLPVLGKKAEMFVNNV